MSVFRFAGKVSKICDSSKLLCCSQVNVNHCLTLRCISVGRFSRRMYSSVSSTNCLYSFCDLVAVAMMSLI